MATRFFSATTQLVSLLGLLGAIGCASAGPEEGGTAQNNVSSACAAESDDGPDDKVECSIDTDCDADEVCLNGKCTGMDGEVEDDEKCGEADDDADDDDDAEGADDDDADDDDADDEGGADKIYCSTDADCDSDEVCVNGKCD